MEKTTAIAPISQRIDAVREMRLESKKEATRERAEYPYEFGELRYKYSDSTILIPRVSSERRRFIPFGYIGEDVLVSDSAQAIYNCEPWVLSVISSTMHVIWVRAVGGRLKSDYRYSSVLCYNTFPFPNISKRKMEELTQRALSIIEVREKYSDRTLAELYDPDKMPLELIEAHKTNDEAVERCYRVTPFNNQEERLEYLFKLYEKMIHEELNASTLFAEQKKTRKKK